MFKEFKNFKPSENEKNENFDGAKFYDLLKKFDALMDIKINFVGSFIWLEDLEFGATYRQKETIKSIIIDGYNSVKFAPTKKLWYFSPADYVQKSKSKKDFEEIKKTYGAKSFNSKSLKQLN